MSRTQKVLFLFLIAFLATTSQSSHAVAKAGDACKKAGSTTVSGGKKFTCIKSGKKLVWNKGVAVAKPKPVQTPTPVRTPTPMVSPTPSPTPTIYVPPTPITTPIPAPIVEKAPTGFADLVENYRGIPGAVWNEAQKLAASGSEKTTLNLSMGLTQSCKPKSVHHWFI